MSKLVGRQIKESPRDAETVSHVYLVRGGYVRPVSSGIYSLLPLGRRVTRKIERIVREEMEGVGCQEVLMPVVLPAELWQQSGRYQSVGEELLRFSDRNAKAMILSMTHEEASVQMLRSEISSYRQLPAMIYHMQTKYRDEARPRAGLIRVREFVMKDAYSFHVSQECLERFYDKMHEAYDRVFQRIGLPDVVSILSGTGMMGGAMAHEFMAIAESGEDTIFMSPDGAYMANRDVATAAWCYRKEDPMPLEKVHTPGQESIDEVSSFLGIDAGRTGKSVFYTDGSGHLYLVVIRGDLDVNEAKLCSHLGLSEIGFADDVQIRASGAEPGYASPMGVDVSKVRVIFDTSARESSNLVVGANEADYHYRNFNLDRDMASIVDRVEVVDVATVRAGDPCPVTGRPLEERRGIEVGNIFQLGTKYSDPMEWSVLGEDGTSHPVVMGSYGMGIGRAMAAVIEQCHDDFGPVWPISIAPYQVHICAIDLRNDNVKKTAESLYGELSAAGIEVLYDDRDRRAGPAFADADLIGIPYRLIVSKKNTSNGEVELKTRDGNRRELIPRADVCSLIERLLAECPT